MGARRGSSGLSLVVGIDKPSGMSSHDVVNRVRRIFGERRVGHTGTLDPLATGVLPICVGPATRLDRYLTGHDKRYRVTARFGFETTTDDAEGQPTMRGPIIDEVRDADAARARVSALVGQHEQVPPLYSAVKVGGQRAYKLARSGGDAQLESRTIQVREARFAGLSRDGEGVSWTFEVAVSKGTYIRSLVRDMGRELGCPAHMAALRRMQAGPVGLEDCVSLEALEEMRERAALDPVRLLGFPFARADALAKPVGSGAHLRDGQLELQACEGGGAVAEVGGQFASIIVEGRLKAIYRRAAGGAWTPDCVFSTGVLRG